jgi:hypothetical protein
MLTGDYYIGSEKRYGHARHKNKCFRPGDILTTRGANKWRLLKGLMLLTY